MGETVRMYEPLQGVLPPQARFNVVQSHVIMSFTLQTVERFGVGTEFRSANLYHIRDTDLNTERIMLELFPEAEKGHRRLTYMKLNKRAKIHITDFLREFEVAFKEHCSYPVWATGPNLYVDLIH